MICRFLSWNGEKVVEYSFISLFVKKNRGIIQMKKVSSTKEKNVKIPKNLNVKIMAEQLFTCLKKKNRKRLFTLLWYKKNEKPNLGATPEKKIQ